MIVVIEVRVLKCIRVLAGDFLGLSMIKLRSVHERSESTEGLVVTNREISKE